MPKVITAAVAAAVLGTLAAGSTLAATPKERLRDKQAQAQQVLAQVNALDARFGATVEAWNGAKYDLDQAQRQLAADRRALRTAERQRRLVLRRVIARVVALYQSDPPPSALAILLGARSLGSVLDELQVAHAVAAADHRLVLRATAARKRYATAVRNVAETELRKREAFDQLGQQRAQIGSMLTKRRELLSSIQSEVSTLRAEEQRRQAQLEADARARLARAAEERRQAEERAKAARQASPKPKPAPAPTTTTTPTTNTATTTTTPTTTTPTGPTSGGHPEAATIALKYLGVPYQWGGATPAGFDCSGLVMYVYAQLGISLPHFAAAQYTYGSPVSQDALQPGDLVFFDNLDHVAIYIGGGQVVHAPSTGDVVKISDISDWGAGYVGARRI